MLRGDWHRRPVRAPFLRAARLAGEKLSYESGFIALLIFVLMITYLAGFFVPAGGAWVKAVWWTHTLALLIFLPLIPHTKHLHLILSPVTVFLSRGDFSRIPPLDGDEDFGLIAGKDVTRLVALQAYSCVECGRCTEHCPAANTGKELNPKQIILGMRGYLNEYGPASEELLIGKHNSQEAAFQCTTCGSCEYQCPVGIEHLPMIVGLRRGMVNTGAWDDGYGTKLFLALERNGNALGLSSADRDKFIQKQQFPIFDGSQEYCLWLGCMGAYDPQRARDRGVVRAGDGAPGRQLRRASQREVHAATRPGAWATTCSSSNWRSRTWRRSGSTKSHAWFRSARIACGRSRTDWREYGEPPRIEHHSEFLARYREKLPADGAGETDCVSRSLLPGPLPRHLRRAAGGAGTFGSGRRAAAVARTQFLLWRGRRARVPGGREGQPGEPRAGAGTGGDRRRHDRRGLPVLQHHVSGCAGGHR